MLLARVYDQGNGFPSVGEYCQDHYGQLYRVAAVSARVQNSPEGCWVYAMLSDVPWGVCAESDEHSARAVANGDFGG